MLDVSFSELLVILLVALVVLGPEKLHGVVRTVGRWSGRARVYLRNLTAELERETEAAELKKQFADAHRILREHASAVQSSARELTGQVQASARELTEPVNSPPKAAEPGPADADPGHGDHRR